MIDNNNTKKHTQGENIMKENRSLESKVNEYMRASRLRNQASQCSDIEGVYVHGDTMKYWEQELNLEIQAGSITKDAITEWLRLGIQP